MQVIIKPSVVRGSIQAPASKSSMQRACAAALLARGKTVVRNPGHSNDDQAAIGVIRALGAQAETFPSGDLEIISTGVQPVSGTLDCGESGLGIRMFTPIMALSEKQLLITGRGSLLNRPMDFFDEVLPQLGVTITSNKGRLPVTIQGPLRPANITIDGSLSSQFLTGLLMAYAAVAASPVTIQVENLKSRPYIDLTLQVMKDFGLATPTNEQYQSFHFSGEEAIKQKDRIYRVEADWSGGAFLLVAGAIAGKITIEGLDLRSTQADRAMVEALTRAGANMKWHEERMTIEPAAAGLSAFDFDATDCPDLFPPLVALAAYAQGKTTITGARRLTHKESNRALTLMQEFGKMGVVVTVEEDLMTIEGNGKLKGTSVHSHHDHRIAMACAVAAIGATGDTTIEEAQAIDKSYPDFFDDLKTLGVSVDIQQSLLNVQN